MESAADWPPPAENVSRKPKVAQFCAAPWPNFTPALTPVDAIDYVITHELCHVAEPHHGAAFFDLLDKVMPDWERRKQRLERAMA